jgi:rubrerythrin
MAILEQDVPDVVPALTRWCCDECGRAFWVTSAVSQDDEHPTVCPWCGEEDAFF